VGFPAIIYNGKTITLSKIPYKLSIEDQPQVLNNRSASGIAETLLVRTDTRIEWAARNFRNRDTTDATLKRQLRQWIVWASMGKAWNLAIDSTDAVLTTSSGAIAAGASFISLTSLTGIVANNLYVLRDAMHLELVKVTALNSPGAGQVTLAETVNFTYPSGARFRSERYWPGRLVMDRYPIIEHEPLFYDLEMALTEDVNAI
jgi:hypothetical protein